MYSSNFSFLTDIPPPDFCLPPAVEALPTPELRLLALLYMGHKGIMPSHTPLEVSDRLHVGKIVQK